MRTLRRPPSATQPVSGSGLGRLSLSFTRWYPAHSASHDLPSAGFDSAHKNARHGSRAVVANRKDSRSLAPKDPPHLPRARPVQSLWVYWLLLSRHSLTLWSLYIAPVAFTAPKLPVLQNEPNRDCDGAPRLSADHTDVNFARPRKAFFQSVVPRWHVDSSS